MYKINLTWACSICGDERPDECISVKIFDISHSLGVKFGTATQNVKYCNDRKKCEAGALKRSKFVILLDDYSSDEWINGKNRKK